MEDWSRWIVTSIYKHFDDAKGSYPLYLDPLERDSIQEPTRFELRINGPDIEELSNNYFRVLVDINLLAQYKVATSDTTFALQEMIGLAQTSFFTRNISIKKYGSGVGDDGSTLGCLEKISKVDVTNFGRIKSGSDLVHTVIEADYRVYLTIP